MTARWTVGLDIGRYKVKALAINPRTDEEMTISFATHISEISPSDIERIGTKNDKEEFILKYGGKIYLVGEVSQRIGRSKRSFEQDSKANKDALIYALAAMRKLGVDGEVNLMTCSPMDNVVEDRKSMRKLFVGENVANPILHWVSLDGEPEKFIKVVNFGVLAEAQASSCSIDPARFINHLSLFVNIGSFKSNFAAFDHNGNPFPDRSGSMDEIGFSTPTMLQIKNKHERAAAIVTEAMNELTSRKWDQPYFSQSLQEELPVKVFVCGGAAELLTPLFRNQMGIIPNLVSVEMIDDPGFSDARGCLYKALEAWG
jgi:hypothetical protein